MGSNPATPTTFLGCRCLVLPQIGGRLPSQRGKENSGKGVHRGLHPAACARCSMGMRIAAAASWRRRDRWSRSGLEVSLRKRRVGRPCREYVRRSDAQQSHRRTGRTPASVLKPPKPQALGSGQQEIHTFHAVPADETFSYPPPVRYVTSCPYSAMQPCAGFMALKLFAFFVHAATPGGRSCNPASAGGLSMSKAARTSLHGNIGQQSRWVAQNACLVGPAKLQSLRSPDVIENRRRPSVEMVLRPCLFSSPAAPGT